MVGLGAVRASAVRVLFRARNHFRFRYRCGQTELMVVLVRRMRGDDVAMLKSMRLQALLDTPSAFGSTYEREVAFSDEVWQGRLRPEGHAHFAVFAPNGRPVGMVAVMADADEVYAAGLVGMWVACEVRGTGAADSLIVAAIEHARAAGFTTLRLWITDGNDRAEGCYRRHSFTRTGRTEIRARDGETEIEMVCDLKIGATDDEMER